MNLTATAGDALPPPMHLLVAPPQWTCIDLLSDIHLQASEPQTRACWEAHLRASPAQALFILGDLFEVWVGDDILGRPGFEADCGQVLADISRHKAVFFLAGNRDFLVGPAFCRATGVQRLDEPVVLDAFGQRWLLAHGDALCTDDQVYQRFRAEVRTPAWQQAFLAQPLDQRLASARHMREESQRQQAEVMAHTDINPGLARHWLAHAGATQMIHGHTHRPGVHPLDGQGIPMSRHVLSDWEANTQPPRGDVLRLTAQGLHRVQPGE